MLELAAPDGNAPRAGRPLPSPLEPATPSSAGEAPPAAVGRYVEAHRTPELSVGHYDIPAGGVDPQSPHTEDEVYVVLSGRARLVGPEADLPVGPGSVVFVPAGEQHRFVEVTAPLRVVVVFGPAEHTRGR